MRNLILLFFCIIANACLYIFFSTRNASPIKKNLIGIVLTPRFILGDFNGDQKQDTLFESFKSQINLKEMSKQMGSLNFENNLSQIRKQQPMSEVYSSDKTIPKHTVTKSPQHAGIINFCNLGDLNEDNSEEFGYMINWLDWSNMNTYYIFSIKANKIIPLFSYSVHERNFTLPKKVKQPRTIEYNFLSDSGTMETQRYKF